MLFHNHILHIIVFILFIINIYAKVAEEDIVKTLDRWVSLTSPLVTWNSPTSNRNLIEPNTSIKNTSVKINNLTIINNRVKNLICTYGFHAQRHFEELHTIVENDLLIDEITKIVSALKTSYLNVALKMLKTISVLGYEKPIWMSKMIPFLQKHWSENDFKDLADLIITIIEFQLNYQCNVPKLPPTNRRMINIMLKFDSETEEILTINLIKEIYSLNSMTVDNWLEKQKVPKYISKKYFSNNFLPREIPEKYSSNPRICGNYLFSQLIKIAENVQNNILDSYWILDQNKKIVPFKNFGDFRPDNNLKILNANEINMEVTPKIENNYQPAQLLTFKTLINSLVYSTFWHPLGMDKLVESNKQLTNLNNHTKLDRSFFSKLKNTKNFVMDKLHIIYLHYASVHANQALLLLQYIKLTPGKKTNYGYIQHLIQLYSDISLMTIATFTNNKYYSTEWMVHFALYCVEESSNIVHPEDYDGKIDESILKTQIIIAILEQVNSKINPKKLQPTKFDIKGIQFDDNNTSNKLYVNLLREYKLYKKNDFSLMPHIDVLYSNLIEVAALLEFNSAQLSYEGYDKFIPLNWLFKENQISEGIVKSFRWDTVEKWVGPTSLINEKDNYWRDFRTEIAESIKSNIDEHQMIFGSRTMKLIDTSIFVHSHIINLLQILLIRNILVILIHCFRFRAFYSESCASYSDYDYGTESYKKFFPNYSYRYDEVCGISSKTIESINRLLVRTELNTDPVLIRLLEEIKQFPKIKKPGSVDDYEDIGKIDEKREKSFTEAFQLGTQRLNEISIRMGLKNLYPITACSSDGLNKEAIASNRQAGIRYLLRPKAYGVDLEKFTENFLNVYKNNFYRHNLLMKSLGHFKPRKISLGYKKGNILF